MEFYSKKEFQNLMVNEEFIEWVKNPNPASDEYWQRFLHDHPQLEEELLKAKGILKRLKKENKKIDEEQLRELWSGIQLKLDSSEGKVRTINVWMAAASVLLLLGVGGLLWFVAGKNAEVDYQAIAKVEPEGNKVQLILSDNSRKVLQSKVPSISYKQAGEILIDSVSLKQADTPREKEPEVIFNQLVVPYGKRSNLILSDGTSICLNSGSRVIYPVRFKCDKREIYVEGEAYLKVAHNAQCPFYVKTNHLKVKVLGTEFNINSHPNELNSSVVLVTGSVQALVRSKKVLMTESEQFKLNNISGEFTKEKVDVKEYISWKDGWMYCNNEKLESIAAKLSRYYNIEIQFKEEETKALTISGKLELKPECLHVFEAISFSAPISCKEIDEKIIISIEP
uniref:FecR family protein n=1 Tax=uncultured Draconibacterium sp. TaxID=1573823 RepID=UPI003217EBD7